MTTPLKISVTSLQPKTNSNSEYHPNFDELRTKSAHYKYISELCSEFASGSDYLVITKCLQIILQNELLSSLEKSKARTANSSATLPDFFQSNKKQTLEKLSDFRENLKVFISKLGKFISRCFI